MRSNDLRFGVQLEEGHMARLIQFCVDAGSKETGGILLGRYSANRDNALVTGVLGPPPDSKSGANWFLRGVTGLQETVGRAWNYRREYYVGEWHFHPENAATASRTDMTQMREISVVPAWKCPEPVLLIIGGDPKSNWSISAYVVAKGDKIAELLPL
jgi:integrative and conjugative element protein (TIGR02256 family)